MLYKSTVSLLSKLVRNIGLVVCLGIAIFLVLKYSAEVSGSEFCSTLTAGVEVKENVRVEEVRNVGEGKEMVVLKTEAGERLLGFVDSKHEAKIGGEYLLRGKLQNFKSTADFDYERFYRLQGICKQVKIHSFDYKRGGVWPFLKLQALRRNLVGVVVANFDTSTSSLLIAVIFGDTYLFSDSQEEDFQVLGITHLVAVSGANFSLIVGLVNTVLFRFNKTNKSLLTILVATVYIFLIGLTNFSAYRAYLFFLLYSLQQLSGRKLHLVQFVVVAMLIVALTFPRAFQSVGFQLSMFAWLITKCIVPDLSNKFTLLNKFFRDEFVMIIIATVLLAPLTLAYFSRFNLFSIISNLLLVPLFSVLNISYVFALGFVFLPFLPKLLRTGAIASTEILSHTTLKLIENLAPLELIITRESFIGRLLLLIFLFTILKFIFAKIIHHATTSEMAKYAV